MMGSVPSFFSMIPNCNPFHLFCFDRLTILGLYASMVRLEVAAMRDDLTTTNLRSLSFR